MVKEMEQAFDGEDQDSVTPDNDQPAASNHAHQKVLSNRPAALLDRIYPFMLSKDFNIASDLCLFGGCSET